MSDFWSNWIIILTVISIVGMTWILFANRKVSDKKEGATTGHIYDGIEEYDNPLPAWWFYMFLITIIFGVGYLVAYPGMGNFKGLLGWTSIGQWEQQLSQAKEKYGPVFAQYSATPLAELAGNRDAMKMGQRLFSNNCAQCHGGDARGGYGFPNLADSDWLYGGDPETIKTSITNGRIGAMPPWGAALGAEGVENVSQYVLSLAGTAHDQAKAAAGQPQYQALCIACHGPEGKGNPLLGAPNLSDETWLYGGSLDQIKHSIQAGRNGNMPGHSELLNSDKIHILAAYVYSLSQGN
jgi:cytochrome c oxidase cbb3-type subunit 3